MNRADALGLIASAMFIARLIPQPWRLARFGVAAGVSPLAVINGAIVAVAWTAYGLSVHLPIVWAVSVVAIVPGVWAVLLLRHEVRASDIAGASAWVGVLLLAALVGWFAAVLALGVFVTQGPQLWRALREPDLSGLSPATWWLSILDAATWGAYGIVVGDDALRGYAVVLSTSALVVLGRIWWTRRASTTVVPEAVRVP